MRREMFWILGLLTLGVLGCGAAQAQRPPPNILFIYSDDQSYKTVGCYPEALPGAHTPNIDALARSGLRFHGAFMGAWCTPSRATVLTGRWPHAIESMRPTEPYPSGTYDPKLAPFWPRVFREKGYVTAQIGKWHTGVDAGTGRDWDWQIVWNRPKHPANAGNYYKDQVISFNGEERSVPGYSTDNYTSWATEFIRGAHRDAGKPWMLWLCYGAIHGPTTPAERHLGLHKSDPIRTPSDILPPRTGKPSYLLKTQSWVRAPDGRIVAGRSGETFGDAAGRQRATFDGFVHQSLECTRGLDEGVGALMQALRESGQLGNTLVVYTADQGFGMGEHGFRTKLAPYDATYRSPLIVSWPGVVPAGRTSPHCVTGPDLIVTFFAAAGIRLPWRMHGRDLSPVLRDPERKWTHPAFYEYTGDLFGSDVARVVRETPEKAEYHDVPWYVAVREDGWKYIRYLKTREIEELYHLSADPEELRNLASDPSHVRRLEEMRRRLEAELRRTDAPFAGHLPPRAR